MAPWVAILPSWADAQFGALDSPVVLVGVVFGFLAHGPMSLRAGYERDVDRLLTPSAGVDVLTDAESGASSRVGAALSPRERSARPGR